MALDMGLFHDPLDTNGVKTLPPISGAFDILGGDPMAGVLTTSQKSADLERTRRAKQETFGPELSLYSGFLDDLSPEGEAAATTRSGGRPGRGEARAADARKQEAKASKEGDRSPSKASVASGGSGEGRDARPRRRRGRRRARAKCDLARLKVADLRACVHNMDHVDGGEDIFKPSSSTTKHRDRSKAATLIQTVARRVVARKRFLSHRVRRDAAVSIQSQARRKLAVAAVLDGIARLRSERATHWDALSRAAPARRRAPRAGRGARRDPRAVAGPQRARAPRRARFQLSQAMQIARLCAAADPNTHVVYVSPVELGDELVDYYQRVLSLARAAAPATTTRRGRRPGVDAAAGRELPLHGANIPSDEHPRARDIYDEEDFCVALAKLVAGHLDVARWKFGVDADARDVLSTDGYERIVAVHPAAAAPVEALAGATAAVARRLFDRGVLGRKQNIFNTTSM
ncbi:IQ motif [Aureococcus anophagefferens]|uniref:IQ motif n=1 Tax=Aureococcus anophagefferens TaxID=44056 RepID=A0ABR1FJY2_AURAN